MIKQERCRSPINPKCGRKDIVVTIRVKDKMLPICRKCWKKIAYMDVEWGENGFRKVKKKR